MVAESFNSAISPSGALIPGGTTNNENPTAAIQPSAARFSDKPAWPDSMARPQQANENPTAARQPPQCDFRIKNST
jgi:hypothetical protein